MNILTNSESMNNEVLIHGVSLWAEIRAFIQKNGSKHTFAQFLQHIA